MKATSKIDRSKLIKGNLRPPRVYISYRRDGSRYASELAEFLKSQNVIVTLSDEINLDIGKQWVDSIQNWLSRTDVLIVVITREYSRSDYAMSEIEFYRRIGRRPILPIVVGNLPRSAVPTILHDIQWALEPDSALYHGPGRVVLRAIAEIILNRPETTIDRKREYIRKKRPLNEGKLILVGRGEVGKTSLVRRLTADEFRGDESKTQGINISKWSLRRGSGSFRLNVWDFGGQEIMHATHQFFLTQRSLYLLVLNGREGAEDLDAEYWIRQIESFGGESPIIVVQNKIAQHPFELNYRGIRARYPQILDFVKTDCAENIGIDELRRAIRKCIGNMPEIRMPFPISWSKIKESLAID